MQPHFCIMMVKYIENHDKKETLNFETFLSVSKFLLNQNDVLTNFCFRL